MLKKWDTLQLWSVLSWSVRPDLKSFSKNKYADIVFVYFPLVISSESHEFPVAFAKDFFTVLSFVGSKSSRWRSYDTDHPSVLTPGHVIELIEVILLALFPTVPRILINSSEGTLTITFCPFLQDRNHLVFNKWLSIIIARMSGKLKLQALSHPFSQDLSQTVADIDISWIGMMQGTHASPSVPCIALVLTGDVSQPSEQRTTFST